MATTHRRQSVVHHRPRNSLSARVLRAASSRPAIVIGTLGLVALTVAILGPKRLERAVFLPLRKAVAPQAEKLWDQTKPVRDELATLFHKAGNQRETLVRDFQSWIGHFRAS